jgi:hypothetical protein
MKKSKRCCFIWIQLAAAMLVSNQAWTAPATFTVLSNESQLTLSGTIVYGVLSAPVSTQSSGSLTTSYIGSIHTDMDGSNITFTGDSTIAALINGTWQPAPGGAAGTSAPADYGGKATVPFIVTAYGALRSVGMDVASPTLTMTNNNFDSRSLVFSFLPGFLGTLDFAATTGQMGAAALTGSATNTSPNNASLTSTGNVQRLRLPIDATYPIGSGELAGTTLRFAGQIVATRVLPPLITSIVVTNETAVVTAAYASLQSQLQSSTNLVGWVRASVTAINVNGLIVFTAPATAPIQFFRVQN